MADDHINLAVATNGTLYAAVKTSYSGDEPVTALLVRGPSGVWEDLHGVDTGGTAGIVVLNEAVRSVMVVFTRVEGGSDICYKQSDMDSIDFDTESACTTLMTGVLYDATSTRQRFVNELVVLATSSIITPEIRSILFAP